jgi:guanylate kinase
MMVVIQMDNKEHVLLCVMGRTASGKDSLSNKLCERTGLKLITSYTTRPQRVNEGDTHIFTTKDTYNKALADGNMAAYTEIAGNVYWTTIDQLYENDVYIIDPVGVQNLRNLNLPNLRLVTVFINTPDDVRKERALNKRGDDRATFMKRDIDERDQFRAMLRNADFDYAISNIDASKAYSVLRWISTVEGVWQNNIEEEVYNVENSN